METWESLDKIKKKFVMVDPQTNCWMWTGFKNNKGYGIISVKGRQLKAHRYIFHLVTGFDLNSPLLVMHTCFNKCVNPDHLISGTESQNRTHYWWNYQKHQNQLQKGSVK